MMTTKEPRDGSLLIGLHKLAEQNGDGLVPELFALLSGQAPLTQDDGATHNVVAFPGGKPATAVVRRHSVSAEPTEQAGATVLPLRRP
jgi:hypothetical protein